MEKQITEIIVLTRDQYISDLQKVATIAAEMVIKKYLDRNRPEIVSRAEAARILGKSKSTIKNMIEEQRIKTTSDGKGIPYTEIERYINKT